MKGDYEIPKFISDASANLISKILDTDPNTRYDIEQIREHWFTKISTEIYPDEGLIVGLH